jgi:hypothetical protein
MKVNSAALEPTMLHLGIEWDLLFVDGLVLELKNEDSIR